MVSAAAFLFLRRPALASTVGGLAARRGRALVGMIPSAKVAGEGGMAVAGSEMTLESIAPKLTLWFTLFVTSAAFHSAEIAITTLYPWKVKEFAEEEGENSPFQVGRYARTTAALSGLVPDSVCAVTDRRIDLA